MKQRQPEVPSGKGEAEKEMPKEGQQSHQKTRQRTIFEFAGMRNQDRFDGPRQNEAKETLGEQMDSNPMGSGKMARIDQQSGTSTPKPHMEEVIPCQDSPAPDREQSTKQ